jgi:hypothetical protein
MVINLPVKICSDFAGYETLIALHSCLHTTGDTNIELNFRKVRWLEANLAAILGSIKVRHSHKKITITGLQNKHSILSRNHFLSSEFSYPTNIDYNNTTISYQKFSPTAAADFMIYIKKELLTKPDFPKHSQKLGEKIAESIFELYENARTHGRCEHIFTCGQYYPQKKRLDITIVDTGQTIKSNVNHYLNKELSGSEAIEWALQAGNTTKTANIPGGLGLNIMFEFIQLNKGKVQIVSADGFWEYRKEKRVTKLFNDSFPGTIVNIEFNLNDNAYYSLKQEDFALDKIF